MTLMTPKRINNINNINGDSRNKWKATILIEIGTNIVKANGTYLFVTDNKPIIIYTTPKIGKI